MIYDNLLQKYDLEAKKALESLFQKAEKNQSDENDLLLVLVHGFFDGTLAKPLTNDLKLSPYVFGIGEEGMTNKAQYDFFHYFRTTYLHGSKEDLIKVLSEHSENWKDDYNIVTQLELLVYLKFWESDFILKQLYNLNHQLLHGLEYDWHKDMKKAGKKDLIENQIIKCCKNKAPIFHNYIKSAYNRQIRNAAAHSQFFFLGDSLNFTNYDPNDSHNLKSMKIDDWEIIFHRTLLLYNHLIGMTNKYHNRYKTEAINKHYGKKVRIIKQDGTCQYAWLKYIKDYDRWVWYKNWASSYIKTFNII